MEKIISLQNSKIKNIVKLRRARERRKQDSILIEGQKEISLALAGGLKITDIFYCESMLRDPESLEGFDQELVTIVSAPVFRKISYRQHPDGLLAVARPEYMELSDLQLGSNPLLVILESVEKPGNLGAILRTADAVGADALIINDSQTDIFNPNVIRASRGTVFSISLAIAGQEDTQQFLKKNKICSFASSLDAKKKYTEVDYKKGAAILLGAEDKGLSSTWQDKADEFIKIPMQGQIDSLNVSVSAGIMLYEVLRQRGKSKC